MGRRILSVLLALCTFLVVWVAPSPQVAHAAPGTRYYVTENGAGDGKGGWASASSDLAGIMDAAGEGDEIWVGKGTYSLGDNPANTFQLKKGVKVYGGFAGGETELGDRDWETNKTVLDGNNTAYHVVTGGQGATPDDTRLDGFTVKRGNANGPADDDKYGGGMYNAGSSPTVANCTFSNNTASIGGGMYNVGSNPTVTGCTFSNNTADVGGGIANIGSSPSVADCTFSGNTADVGGGMANGHSNPTVTGCDFSGNTADYYGGGIYNYESSPEVTDCDFTGNNARSGGGMYNGENSSPEVTGCDFSGNTVSGNGGGGGMYNHKSSPAVTNCTFTGNNVGGNDGGGVYNYESSPEVTGCDFTGNNARSGGGMYNGENSSPVVTGCDFSGNTAGDSGGGMMNSGSNPTVTNCTFSNNKAEWIGGAMSNVSSSPMVINCTFSDNKAEYPGGNTAGFGGGMANIIGSSPTVVNTILWGNSGTVESSSDLHQEKGTLILKNCVVNKYKLKGGAEEDSTNYVIKTDPKLIALDKQGNDPSVSGEPVYIYGLDKDSSALNAGLAVGEHSEGFVVPETDQRGAPRKGTAPDVGAFEVVEYAITFDANGGGETMEDVKAHFGVGFELPGNEFTAPVGKEFDVWAVGSLDGDQKSPGETYLFTGPATVFALWKVVYYSVTVNGGTASSADSVSGIDSAAYGTTVTVTAGLAPSTTQRFKNWVVDSGGVDLVDSNAASTTFSMPAENVALRATYEDIPVDSVSLGETTVSLTVGGTAILNATVLPENAANQTVTWVSDNTDAVTVDGGKITAVGLGQATITVTADGGKTASCTVTVNPVLVGSVSLDKDAATLLVGGTETLVLTVLPDNATDPSVNWESSDTDVATVAADGTITAVGVGSATITVTAADGSGETDSCEVTVNPVLVGSVSLDKDAVTLLVGGSETLSVTVLPATATNKTVNWVSDKPGIASVDDNGKVTAHSVGTATITATAADGSGETDSCEVTVNPVLVDSLTLDKDAVTLLVGGSETLSVTVLPATATNKTVNWVSDKPGIASVDDNGKVTAHSVGSATITATAADGSGETDSCEVTVNPVLVTGVSLDKSEISLIVGGTDTLSPTVSPENATDPSVNWESSDTDVATVSADGTVTAVGVGSATITVTAADGSGKQDTCEVTVNPVLVTGVTLDKSEISLTVGGTDTLSPTVSPENATDPSVTWVSDNTDVATVDGGKITAVGVGEAKITVTAADGSGKQAVCEVTVNPVLVTSVTLDKDAVTLLVGGTDILSATVSPDTATNQSVTWVSDNTDVATVDGGKITAVGVGEAKITVTAVDGSGKQAVCEVTVDPVLVTSVSLDESEISLIVGGTKTLSATVSPDTATNQTVTWASDNTDVATVAADGTVTAVGVGSARITVTAADGSGKTDSCEVTVDPVLVTSVSLDKDAVTLLVGGTDTLSATVSPDTATNQTVTWGSDNTDVATVDGGKITAVGVGSATITVTAADGSGETASCTVTVNPVLVGSVTLNKDAVTLLVGGTDILSATVSPDTATNQTVTWVSDNTDVATVDGGKITAVGVGSATITVTAADGSGKQDTCEVTVNPVLVDSLTLDKDAVTLLVGGTETLDVTVLPGNATDKGLTWVSDNTDVATVDGGKITAVGVGSATITVTAADGSGKQDTCEVTVNPVLVDSLTLDKDAVTLLVGGTDILSATVSPDTATNQTVTWVSDNTDVATVSADGKVTAVGVGSATITVTAADGSGKTDSCTVTVDPVLVGSVTLNKDAVTLLVGGTDILSATVSPDTATNQTVTWVSDNTDVATVSADGKVAAVGVGSATITVTAVDGSGKQAVCEVTVNPVLVDSLTLDKDAVTLLVGGTDTLSATVSPDTATNQTVTWVSDNTDVATVSADGTVTTHSVGEATITVTAADGSGKQDTCAVTVNPIAGSEPDSGEGGVSLPVGGTQSFAGTVSLGGATAQDLIWTSSDPGVVTVDGEGRVTAVGVGEATITVTTEDGSKTVTFQVVVEKEPENPVAPEMIEQPSPWVKGSDTSVRFVSTADFADFLNVRVGGAVVDASNYDVKEGSTIVTFKPAFLETLSVGKHPVEIVSRTGIAYGMIEIEAKPVPGTEQTKPVPGTAQTKPVPGTAQTKPVPGTEHKVYALPKTGVIQETGGNNGILWASLVLLAVGSSLPLQRKKKSRQHN